jgi:hypothetical protein
LVCVVLLLGMQTQSEGRKPQGVFRTVFPITAPLYSGPTPYSTQMTLSRDRTMLGLKLLVTLKCAHHHKFNVYNVQFKIVISVQNVNMFMFTKFYISVDTHGFIPCDHQCSVVSVFSIDNAPALSLIEPTCTYSSYPSHQFELTYSCKSKTHQTLSSLEKGIRYTGKLWTTYVRKLGTNHCSGPIICLVSPNGD